MRIKERLRNFEPKVLEQLRHPMLAWARPWVESRGLVAFTRRGTALGVAIGFIAGAIPGPLQVMSAIIMCAAMRANVVAAIVASLYTNPLTIVPIYLAAYTIGQWILPGEHPIPDIRSISTLTDGGWFRDIAAWVQSLGKPLLVGLPILAIVLAVIAYALVSWWWARDVRTRRAQSQSK